MKFNIIIIILVNSSPNCNYSITIHKVKHMTLQCFVNAEIWSRSKNMMRKIRYCTPGNFPVWFILPSKRKSRKWIAAKFKFNKRFGMKYKHYSDIARAKINNHALYFGSASASKKYKVSEVTIMFFGKIVKRVYWLTSVVSSGAPNPRPLCYHSMT